MSVFTRGIVHNIKSSIRLSTNQCTTTQAQNTCTNKTLFLRRHLSGFSFAGPRNLNEIMKLELLKDKTKPEVSEIWMTYHEDKERVHGVIANGDDGMKIIERAESS